MTDLRVTRNADTGEVIIEMTDTIAMFLAHAAQRAGAAEPSYRGGRSDALLLQELSKKLHQAGVRTIAEEKSTKQTRLFEHRLTGDKRPAINEPFSVALPVGAQIVEYTSPTSFWYTVTCDVWLDMSTPIDPNEIGGRYHTLVLADGSREFPGRWQHHGSVPYGSGRLHLLEKI